MAQQFCTYHENEPIKMFCLDCKLVNCLVCQVESHQGHECKSVGKVSDDFRMQLQADIDKISLVCRKYEEDISRFDEDNKLVLDTCASLQTDVSRRAAYIKESIDRHVVKLMKEVEEIRTNKLKEIENKKQEVSRQLTILQSYTRYATEMNEKGSPVDICRHFQELDASCVELDNNRFTSDSDFFRAYSFAFIPSNIEDILTSTDDMIGKVYGKSFQNIVPFSIYVA